MSARTNSALRRHAIGLTAFLLVVQSVSCASPEAPAAAPPVPEPTPAPASDAAALVPLFDCYRSNSAWGYTLSGRVVDVGGRVWAYRSHGKAWLPKRVEEGGVRFYAESDLREKYSDAQASGTVDATALAENVKLIEAAAAGSMKSEDGGARDAGYSGCHAYVRDAAQQRFRDIDLGSDGGVSDTRVTNDSEAAQQLLAWLRSIKVAT